MDQLFRVALILLYKGFACRPQAGKTFERCGDSGGGGEGLRERSGKDAETEQDEDDAEHAIHFVRALTRNILRAHDDALAPDLKAHHQVRPHHIHPAKNE